jgi:hypothetical protein
MACIRGVEGIGKKPPYIDIDPRRLCAQPPVATSIASTKHAFLSSRNHDTRGSNRSPTVSDVNRYASSPFPKTKPLSWILQGNSRCIAFERMCSTLYPLLSCRCYRSGRYSEHAPISHSERLPFFRSETEAVLLPEMRLTRRWQQRSVASVGVRYAQPAGPASFATELWISAAEIGTCYFRT